MPESTYFRVLLCTVRKPINAYTCIKVSYVIDIVFLVHVSATILAVLRKVHYEGWICRDITEDCKLISRYIHPL
jgi:hypothetical protein